MLKLNDLFKFFCVSTIAPYFSFATTGFINHLQLSLVQDYRTAIINGCPVQNGIFKIVVCVSCDMHQRAGQEFLLQSTTTISSLNWGVISLELIEKQRSLSRMTAFFFLFRCIFNDDFIRILRCIFKGTLVIWIDKFYFSVRISINQHHIVKLAALFKFNII